MWGWQDRPLIDRFRLVTDAIQVMMVLIGTVAILIELLLAALLMLDGKMRVLHLLLQGLMMAMLLWCVVRAGSAKGCVV